MEFRACILISSSKIQLELASDVDYANKLGGPDPDNGYFVTDSGLLMNFGSSVS